MRGEHLVDPLEDSDPRQIGPYSPQGRIGVGGMGRVYLAYTAGGRAVAVKVVRPELADDPEFRQRFRQEVAMASRVHGAFTAELVDSDTEGDTPWLATLYVPGMSLQTAVAEHGPLPTHMVWQLLAGVAEALQAIHAAGVIHRDLRPANVLLAGDGPRVIDFGIARAVDATSVTRTGFRVGSPRFMAPEHATGAVVTAAADVFAFGALAVFAASGGTPFGDGADAGVLYRVVNEEPALEGITDPRLRELIARCLAKDPADRPVAAEIIHECAAALGGAAPQLTPGWLPAAITGGQANPGPATPGTPATPAATGTPRPRTVRRPSLAVPILAVSALVVAMVVAGHLAGRTISGSPGRGDAMPPATFTVTNPPDTPTTAPSSSQPAPTAAATTAPTRAVSKNTVASSTARAVAPPAGATVTPALLGTPDWNGYCQATGQGSVQLVSDNAYGWHCSADNGTGDDANAVCAWTFHTSTITNRVSDFNDPNSWQCWRASRELGPVNFTAYCQAIGYPSAYYVSGQNAYGWFCTNDPNSLDLQDACQRLYGSTPPISRFQNFYDQNSWQCWG
jgi:hypothetical protein